jgi:hypothetical protein
VARLRRGALIAVAGPARLIQLWLRERAVPSPLGTALAFQGCQGSVRRGCAASSAGCRMSATRGRGHREFLVVPFGAEPPPPRTCPTCGRRFPVPFVVVDPYTVPDAGNAAGASLGGDRARAQPETTPGSAFAALKRVGRGQSPPVRSSAASALEVRSAERSAGCVFAHLRPLHALAVVSLDCGTCSAARSLSSRPRSLWRAARPRRCR